MHARALLCLCALALACQPEDEPEEIDLAGQESDDPCEPVWSGATSGSCDPIGTVCEYADECGSCSVRCNSEGQWEPSSCSNQCSDTGEESGGGSE